MEGGGSHFSSHTGATREHGFLFAGEMGGNYVRDLHEGVTAIGTGGQPHLKST